MRTAKQEAGSDYGYPRAIKRKPVKSQLSLPDVMKRHSSMYLKWALCDLGGPVEVIHYWQQHTHLWIAFFASFCHHDVSFTCQQVVIQQIFRQEVFDVALINYKNEKRCERLDV